MNKIVRKHFPASLLPKELQEAIGDYDEVTLTIEVAEKPREEKTDWFSRHEHIRRSNYKSTEEVNAYVRSLRDEWSHRER